MTLLFPDDPLIWAQWPKDVPRPTEDEMGAAIARNKAEADKYRALGDYSDGNNMGLAYVMATYTRECWWHLFFPEEK